MAAGENFTGYQQKIEAHLAAAESGEKQTTAPPSNPPKMGNNRWVKTNIYFFKRHLQFLYF